MPYAINGSSLRAIDSESDLIDGEIYSVYFPAVWPPEQPENYYIKQQIAELEATATERRYREAVLGIDNGWLKNLNDQISSLREKLNK